MGRVDYALGVYGGEANRDTAVKAGSVSVGAGDEVRVSQAYIKVTYTAVGGGGASCGSLALLGAGC